MSIENRYDFVIFFDVENGNPNGDPDAGNAPRVDVETGHGFVTDVCIKRKIRNYVELVMEGKEGYNILVKTDKALNTKFTEAHEKVGNSTEKGKKKTDEEIKKAKDFMCKNYFDVRMFGAVMSTGDNPCGIVRGPVQINFARSISPINYQDITITRQAITDNKKFEESKTGTKTEIGKKSIIPYALYRAEGYVSACLANKLEGFCDEDINILWKAIVNMFENDHSAARGKMCLRKLFIFKHRDILGNAPSHILFDKITVEQLAEVPRKFSDYTISINKDLPEGVEFIDGIEWVNEH